MAESTTAVRECACKHVHSLSCAGVTARRGLTDHDVAAVTTRLQLLAVHDWAMNTSTPSIHASHRLQGLVD